MAKISLDKELVKLTDRTVETESIIYKDVCINIFE
jgi:hypothetical protein